MMYLGMDNLRNGSFIEAFLFMRGDPVSISELCRVFETDNATISEALNVLEQSLVGRGIRLQINGDMVTMVTAPEASSFLVRYSEEENSKELSKAALETLAVILYKGPIEKSRIDYIRGVNSVFNLRNLLVRGLIEKVVNSADKRSHVYKPTSDLMNHLGVTRREDLPEFEVVNEKINEQEEAKTE